MLLALDAIAAMALSRDPIDVCGVS